MKKSYLIACGLFLLAGYVQAQTLKGTVYNASGEKIKGASILISGKSFGQSDENGSFSIKLTPGTYQVKTSYLNKQSSVTEVFLQQGDLRELDFTIDASNQLEDVVVVASRKPVNISDIAGTVWVFNREQIEQQAKNGVPLKEMLAILAPGMDIGPQGRTNYGQNMRGRAALVMIDGVSLNSIRSISRQLDAIDPFNIERIEILSGASAIYGGNATGGIINIITRRANKDGLGGTSEIGVRAGLRHSNDHDYRFAQSLQGRGEKLEGRLAVAYQQNGATYGADNEQIFTDITQTDLQYNRSVDVLGTAGYQIHPNHKITVSGQYYNSKFNGKRSLFLGDNLSAFTTGKGELLEMRDGFKSSVNPGTVRLMGTANYHGSQLLGGQDLYVQVSGRSEKLDFYPFPGTLRLATGVTPYMSSSRQNTYYTGLKALLSKSWDKINITYGLDVDFEKFEATQNVYDIAKSFESGGLVNETIHTLGRYPTNRSTSIAGYFQGEYSIIDMLKLTAGLRYQNTDITVKDFVGSVQQTQVAFGYGNSASAIPGGKSSYDMTLVNAGLLLKPNSNHQAWFTYSEGVALADPAKFYGYGTYNLNATTNNWDITSSLNVKDSPLQGIKTNQFELGYRINYAGIKGQVSGFVSKSDKVMSVDRTNFQVVVNEQNLRNTGIEAELSYTYDGFYIGASALLIRSEVQVENDWKKQEVYNASPSKLVAYTGYNIKNWNFRFQSLQNMKLKDELSNEIKAYNTSDLFVGYTLPYGKVNVGVQNLFNTTYQTIWSKRSQILYSTYKLDDLFYYQGRGRTFSVNYTFDF
ncbi:TonB-dependent receptor [Sphingobacterium spiritivorum]|uniref:TonB-dependent receptor n=1 Tax=Sphingobacterium spiritivorum TaxID=258 RepID=UPI003DA3E7B7